MSNQPQLPPHAPVYAARPPHTDSAGAPYTPGPPVNAMAIIALVSSITGWILFPVVGSVVGLVLGYQARKQIEASGESGSGLATAAIILGWIMAGLIVLTVVVSLLFVGLAIASSA